MSDYYLHRKTGGVYRLLHQEYLVNRSFKAGELVAPYYVRPDTMHLFTATDDLPNGGNVAFYMNALTGERWARPALDFHDGRFAQFERPPTTLLAALEAPAGAS